MYKCYVCGKEFQDPTQAAHCTLACSREAERKLAEQKQQALMAEKEKRKSEVDQAYKTYLSLEKEYRKDYGCTSASCSDPFVTRFPFSVLGL